MHMGISRSLRGIFARDASHPISKAMETISKAVFHFANLVGGIARDLRAACSRAPDTRISRPTIHKAGIRINILPFKAMQIAIKHPATSSLSAIGSIIRPKSLVRFHRRARNPSKKSVKQANKNRPRSTEACPKNPVSTLPTLRMPQTISGIDNIRDIVRILGRFFTEVRFRRRLQRLICQLGVANRSREIRGLLPIIDLDLPTTHKAMRCCKCP